MARMPRFAAALAAAALVAGAASGCSAVGDGVRDLSGGAVVVSSTGVPADFPNAVPLADGEITTAGAVGLDDERVWNVSVRVGTTDLSKHARADAGAAIAQQLTDAGFVRVPGTDLISADGTEIAAATTQWLVAVVVRGVGGDVIANYTVRANTM
ncbi:hypothetical protein QT381_10045 [Galbitalea sp. SE-J8]|uniref:hypothetical protein n=1 Tax=Galbitalea sp. SE-J8 TaxID=3054952 RepID=UPI00259CC0B0|nr:hypothetical protein [Galbitalea sp. SE-J8]MDM4763348.1 hypothetical protein [Galbitalea sp. SE-J8]